MKRYLTFITLFIFMMLIHSNHVYASGETTESSTVAGVTLHVTTEEIEQLGARKAIQNALNTARDNATTTNPYIVEMDAGTYTLSGGMLHVYSNTTLDLTGVTLDRVEDAKGQCYNLIRVGATSASDNEEGETGYCYKNITVVGGVLDGSEKSNTVVKVGHASNFTMTGTVLKNAYNAHLMEIAGSKNITIENCSFLDQTIKKSANSEVLTYEAIQLDILLKVHMSGYRSEPLAISDVTINNCSFTNVPRGVGSHTAILNAPFKNIAITNCNFSDIGSVAVQGQNWINCTISNNTITNAPRGIALYSLLNYGQGEYTAEYIANEGLLTTEVSSAYTTPKKNQGIVISNNKITLNSVKDPYAVYTRGAIILYGVNLTTSETYFDNSGNLPKGNYYLSGITISGNTIKTTGHGIRLFDCRNATISNNTITGSAVSGDATAYYGIQAREGCTTITVSSNTVKNSVSNGIFMTADASATSIKNNTVTNAGKYGIALEQSSAATISGNKISSAKKHGIFVYYSSAATTIKTNTITSSGINGIFINYKAKATNITSNTIKKSGSHGIYVSESSNVSKVSKNTVTSSGSSDAITADSTSKISNYTSNIFLGSTTMVSATNRRTGVYVKWKKVTNATSYRIYRKTSATNWVKIGTSKTTNFTDKTAVSGTKYTYAVRALRNGVLGTDYASNAKTRTYVAAPKISSISGRKAGISLKWSKAKKGTGYVIEYSTTSSMSKAKTKKVTSATTLSKKLSKLTKNKTYYVRIRAYKKSGSSTLYSAWSAVKSVKTK